MEEGDADEWIMSGGESEKQGPDQEKKIRLINKSYNGLLLAKHLEGM